MYHPSQSVRTTSQEFDQEFEGQLPPEVWAELAAPEPRNRWPGRPPETEEEIQKAIAWLRRRGYLPAS